MTPHRPPVTGARGRAVVGMGRFVSGVLFSLGLLGLLKSGTDNSPEQLFVFTIHPFTALVWLVLGLVGIAMSVAPERAQLYLVGTGMILLVWAALCLALGAEVSEIVARDTATVAMYLIGGVGCLVVALAPLRLRPSPPTDVRGRTG